MRKVIVIHNERKVLCNLKRILEERGFGSLETCEFEEASEHFISDPAVVACICSYDWKWMGNTGVGYLNEVRRRRPDVVRILLSLKYVRGKEVEADAHFVERAIDDMLDLGSPALAEILRILEEG